MTIKYVTGVLIVTLMMSGIASSAFAGGPRHDYDERYEDVPGAPECWTDGFDDGANDEFDENRNEECIEKGDQYSRGFDAGMKSCTDENIARSSSVESDCEKARNDS